MDYNTKNGINKLEREIKILKNKINDCFKKLNMLDNSNIYGPNPSCVNKYKYLNIKVRLLNESIYELERKIKEIRKSNLKYIAELRENESKCK